MEYTVALEKAWTDLAKVAKEKTYTLKFLNDTYQIDPAGKEVFSLSCNVPAKVFYTVIILHYLAKAIRGLPQLKNEWFSFKELPGGQAYYPTFKKRVLDTVARKYEDSPEAIFDLGARFSVKKSDLGDVAVVLEVCERVPVLIVLYRKDEEFAAEANMLFDKSIGDIFCTEDIVVVAEIVAHSI